VDLLRNTLCMLLPSGAPSEARRPRLVGHECRATKRERRVSLAVNWLDQDFWDFAIAAWMAFAAAFGVVEPLSTLDCCAKKTSATWKPRAWS
jgi:hypothetical protein